MKKVCIIFQICFSIFSCITSPGQNYEWAKAIGAAGNENCLDMVTDIAGNVYIIGNIEGTNIDFDPGPGTALLNSAGGSDIFFAKYDSSGNYLWAKAIGGTNDDIGARIAVDGSGSVYITGWFESSDVDFDPGSGSSIISTAGYTDIYLANYDTDGNYLWAFNIGSPMGEGSHDVCIDNSGHVCITGYFYGTNVDFDPGPGTALLSSTANSGDIFIARYHTNGTLVWAKKVSGPNYEVGNGIITDQSGNVFISGPFMGNVDFDPGAGTAFLTSAGGFDIFIAKYDSSGNYLWANRIGGTGDDSSGDIVTDSQGNVIIASTFHGSDIDFDPGPGTAFLSSNGGSDIAIAKYDTSGNYLWAGQTGGLQDDYAVKVAVDSQDQVYHSGAFMGTNVDFDPGIGTAYLSSAGMEDIYFASYDDSGNFEWAKRIGGAYSDWGNTLALTHDGKIRIAGCFMGSNVDFDPGAGTAILNSSGGIDIFFAGYSPTVTSIGDQVDHTEGDPILYQNHPNPASYLTTFEFTITEEAHVCLKLYSMYGQEINIIIDEDKKPGTYTVSYDLKHVPCGLYVYSLSDGSRVTTKKLTKL
ncbi:MAG: T9SS type A sorting domain-containing protein [Bacteroidales bacterium]|jgi:hypothetical protein|nr:T9SS type A sorting domain-containing protein [Bacteroidales bacterium]